MGTALRLLRPGVPTSIGSLPHNDATAAAAFILRLHTELPAAPQLPARTPAEGMIAQAVDGIDGIAVRPDGSLDVDHERLDPEAPVATTFTSPSWAGLRAFGAAAAGRDRPVKLQLTGPVTLATALVHADVAVDLALRIAGAAARARAVALLDWARATMPKAPLVVFLDEPSLHGWDEERPLPVDEGIDVLSGALAALSGGATTGVHCCGRTDWRLAMSAGPDVLSLPVGGGIVADPAGAAAFLDGGGWFAWGIVPTDRPLGEGHDRPWRELLTAWCELTQGGCDPLQLREQSLVTPVCGLAGHGVSQAERALAITSRISERVEDQAVGARLIVGA